MPLGRVGDTRLQRGPKRGLALGGSICPHFGRGVVAEERAKSQCEVTSGEAGSEESVGAGTQGCQTRKGRDDPGISGDRGVSLEKAS